MLCDGIAVLIAYYESFLGLPTLLSNQVYSNTDAYTCMYAADGLGHTYWGLSGHCYTGENAGHD